MEEGMIRLRTMTRKSLLNWGKFADNTIGQLIDCGKKRYVIWLYYNAQWANFTNEVLDELKITGAWVIEKPGVDEKKFRDFTFNKLLWAQKQKHGDDVGTIITKSIIKRNFKQKSKHELYKAIKETSFTKGQMQAMNHGHMKFR